MTTPEFRPEPDQPDLKGRAPRQSSALTEFASTALLDPNQAGAGFAGGTGTDRHVMRAFFQQEGKKAEPGKGDQEKAQEVDKKGDELRANYLKAFTSSKFEDAEKIAKELIGYRKEKYGPNHALVGESLTFLGMAYEHQGKFVPAKNQYLQAHSVNEIAFGKDHFLTGASVQNAAHMDMLRGEWNSAIPNYKEALRVYELNQPLKNPTVAAEEILTLKDYVQVLGEAAKQARTPAEAASMRTEAIKQRARISEIQRAYQRERPKPKNEV